MTMQYNSTAYSTAVANLKWRPGYRAFVFFSVWFGTEQVYIYFLRRFNLPQCHLQPSFLKIARSQAYQTV